MPYYWGRWCEIHWCLQCGLYLILSFIVGQIYKHKVFISSFIFEHIYIWAHLSNIIWNKLSQHCKGFFFFNPLQEGFHITQVEENLKGLVFSNLPGAYLFILSQILSLVCFSFSVIKIMHMLCWNCGHGQAPGLRRGLTHGHGHKHRNWMEERERPTGDVWDVVGWG